jgi:glutathione S-transferase
VIDLYQFEISPFCDKVRRILHVKGLPYRTHDISMQAAVTQSSKVNPTGKLPALRDGDRSIGDSTDIALYLESTYPDPALLPSDPRRRALVLALEDWADESLYFYEIYLRFAVGRNAEKWVPVLTAGDSDLVQRAARIVIPRHMKGILAKQGLGRKSYEQVLRDMERHADTMVGLLEEGPWLVGDRLTLADIAVFAQWFCIRGAAEGAKAVAARPVLAAWMDRVDEATAAPSAGARAGVG